MGIQVRLCRPLLSPHQVPILYSGAFALSEPEAKVVFWALSLTVLLAWTYITSAVPTRTVQIVLEDCNIPRQ